MTWNNQLLLWVSAALILLSMGGCMKDNCKRTYTLYTPVYKTLREARAMMKSSAPQPVKAPGKLYVYNNYIFLNETQKGIHVIDNSNPSQPVNAAFIPIVGNVDLAVKGNILYADSYSDLVSFDISNPKAVTAKNIVDNVFPDRAVYYSRNGNMDPDSIKLVVDWLRRDTTVDCETYERFYTDFYLANAADKSGSYAQPNIGMGGSMARFTLINNYLYTVTTSMLNTFDLTVADQPKLASTKNLNNGTIETIFPFQNKLFIGSASAMYIYNVGNPSQPEFQGSFSHLRSCDPVIADETYAYVTLRTGTACQGNINRLEILNVTNPSVPALVKTYDMTNPHGLSKDNNLLFICDGKDGVKVYDAYNVNDLRLLKKIEGIHAFDVIAYNNRAIVVGDDGLYQFSYANPSNIRLLSKITIQKD